jgi:hypothetical protein
LRKDVKNKKIPTKAKTIRNIIEICELGYGRVYTWGMKPLHTEKRFLMKLRAMKCKRRKLK